MALSYDVARRTLVMSQQVRYYGWGSNKDHPTYFEDIGRIAEWIAWALEAQETGFNRVPQQMSTIAVEQCKEKFGAVRVYCSLASEAKVQTAWRLHLKERRIAGSMSPKPNKLEFVRLREIEDMRWYRKIYRGAVSLWPHYMSAIIDDADFPYLVGTVADAEAAHVKGSISKRDWDKYRIVMRDQE